MEKNLNMATTVTVTSTYAGIASAEYVVQLFVQNNSLQYVVKHLYVRKTLALRIAVNKGIIQAYSCTASPTGSVTLTERIITPGKLMVREEICRLSLLNTWADDQDTKSFLTKQLPQDFTTWFTADILAQVISAVEYAFWYGNTGSTSGDVSITNANGIHTILTNESTSIKVPSPATTAAGSNGMAIIQRIVGLTPSVVRQHPDFKIGVSASLFFAYQDAFFFQFPANANYNVNNGIMGNLGELSYLGIPIFRFPDATDRKPRAVATFMNPTNGNLHLVTNLEDDMHTLQILDKSETTGDDIIMFKMIWNQGQDVGKPEYCVVYGNKIG